MMKVSRSITKPESSNEERKQNMNKESLSVILVHGSGHGAWCWYKVVAELQSKGYNSVTAIDLAASGADSKRIPEDVWTFEEYNRPLMEFMSTVPDGEKVILVGHSFGGISLAFAMDAFPQKIAAAVFLTAFLPDTLHDPSYFVEQQLQKLSNRKLQFQFQSVNVPGKSEPLITFCFDSNTLSTLLYQNCSPEDLTMASTKLRTTSYFLEDLRKKPAFTEEGYGTVDKIFIVCAEDVAMKEEDQRWMIQNNGGVKETMEIRGADHMAMFSKPHELSQCIMSIVDKYVSN